MSNSSIGLSSVPSLDIKENRNIQYTDVVWSVDRYASVLPNQMTVYNKFTPYIKNENGKLLQIPRSYATNKTEYLKDHKSKGEISSKAAARIRKAVRLMIWTAQKKRVYYKQENKWFTFYISFVTLTLSSKQIHSDEQIKQQILQPFLRSIKIKYGVHKYIWKAETQDNGNIHFHLTIDKYIHWRSIRNSWNKFQESLGYISASGISDPNSTDVHSVKRIDKLENYLIKYLSKNDNTKRKIEGAVWNCSANLKGSGLNLNWEKYLDEFEVLSCESVIDLKENYFQVIKYPTSIFKQLPPLVEAWKNYSKKLVDDVKLNFIEKSMY